jgi:hypothetical protein
MNIIDMPFQALARFPTNAVEKPPSAAGKSGKVVKRGAQREVRTVWGEREEKSVSGEREEERGGG